MIIDKRQIQTSIDHVLALEMYLPLTREDFDEACPIPAIAVNVVARSADEAAILLRIELAQANDLRISGIVVFLQSISITMRDLEHIDAVFPRCERFKRGISFTEPEGGEIKVWFFAKTIDNILSKQ